MAAGVAGTIGRQSMPDAARNVFKTMDRTGQLVPRTNTLRAEEPNA